jgi:hypothetical protein
MDIKKLSSEKSRPQDVEEAVGEGEVLNAFGHKSAEYLCDWDYDGECLGCVGWVDCTSFLFFLSSCCRDFHFNANLSPS